jgi:hypothetical protein
MRRVDAPPAGWYPDPESRTALRWWDGLDWTEARRAPPSQAELLSFENQAAFEAAHRYVAPNAQGAASFVERVGRSDRPDPRAIEEARRASRAEIDYAAEVFARKARSMRDDIEPLISQYTSRLVRWIKFAAIVAIILLVAYFVFQVVAQASLFEWIGDRIDNLTDENGAAVTTAALSAWTGGS